MSKLNVYTNRQLIIKFISLDHYISKASDFYLLNMTNELQQNSYYNYKNFQ